MDLLRRAWAWVTALVVAAAALPVAIIAWTRDDRSLGDIALIELRIRDALTNHPPLTGAYSRYGWSHPGPLLFDLFAIPYRVLGNDADALRWTTLAFNVVVIVVTMWVVRGRGVAAWLAVAAATLLLSWGLIPHSLSDGWNVTVAILPFLLTIVACWCALCGDRWALLVAVLAFVFVLQAHIGFGLVVLPLVLMVLAVRATAAVRAGRRPRRPHALAAGIVVVLFLPVLYDSLANWPGNIGRLVKWSVRNDEQKVGAVEGLRIIGRTSSLSFLGHPQFPGRFVLTIESVSTGFAPFTALVLLAAATWLAWRRRFRAELLLCSCLWLVWAAGAVAAASIAEPLLPWLIDWLQPLGWLTWAALALVAWRVVQCSVQPQSWWPTLRATGAAVAAILFIWGAADYWHETVTTRYLTADSKQALDDLTSGALTWGDAPIPIVHEGDALTAGTMMNGIVNRYDQRGERLCVQAELAYQFSEWRVCRGDPAGYLLVRNEDFVVPPPEGATIVAITDPMTPDQRAEADRLSEELATILVETGYDDLVYVLYSSLAEIVLDRAESPELLARRADVERLDALRNIGGTRYGLYFIPA